MRIALVSPYSWTYPGGVNRHIESLSAQLLETGHDVRVFAPFDPPDRLSARLHKGTMPEEREVPANLTPLGRSLGVGANGAMSNLAYHPYAISTLRRELAQGDFDVVHLHEPVAPVAGWDTLCSAPLELPLVATFHCYSTNVLSNNIANLIGARRRLNRLHQRIAVSEAAAWTARRFYGGRYRVIPNGVEVPADPLAVHMGHDDGPLRIVFIGQAVERKGLPLLLRAFEALRDHVDAELTLVGADADDVAPLLHDARGVTALGRVSDEEKAEALRCADVLCAPSLGGESFGMVLTEAFAAGTPVVASDIPGYQDVVRDGVDGLLVPRGDATALAEALRDLALDPQRRREMGRAAAAQAPRYAWPRIAEEVVETYEAAVAVPAAEGTARRAAVRIGALPADLEPRVRARRLPSMEPAPPGARAARGRALARRGAIAGAGIGAAGLAFLGLQRIGFSRIGDTMLAASATWVIVALALMCASMVVRGLAWHAILKAALPLARLKRTDALQGTFIGVLMSATLPARLGEPSRALIVARRSGRPRDNLPAVLGTLVSQTLLNILALVILGVVMFSTVNLFDGHHGALVAFALAPMAVVVGVLALPALIPGGVPSRFTRVQVWVRRSRGAVAQVRDGLRVFRNPRLGSVAVTAQLLAWLIQWMSCYVLLVALGLDHQAGMGAAAAVLFAVNVTAVLPATPSNLGVFQAACVAVLHGAYGVSSADALGYGIILQAVEIATAIAMGTPALLKEGLSWKDVRMRALHASPVTLSPKPRREREAEAQA
jgi:phosphatidylinositol alpha-mannosyltransferase